ncbi:phosphohydrolase [Paenibacillus macquariensis subsp. defensor]|nr:phosphohydrolase [Paenibacillus macquariensis subsp. defensor]
MKRVDVVYCLITDPAQSKILMVRNKDNGRWSLPGGAVEENETLQTAAIREAKEETGLDVEVFGIVAVNEGVLKKRNEHNLFFTFRAKVIGGREEIVRPDEITDMVWVDIEQAEILMPMPFYKEGLSIIVRENMEVSYFNDGIV